MTRRVVAVIPARGGSRRIPRKNIRPFLGRPAISHPIAAARDSGLFAQIVVSTDDEAIADIARQAGATVPFVRPDGLAGDDVATWPVIAHAVRMLCEAGRAPDIVCCLYPTAVFVQASDLLAAWQMLAQAPDAFVFSAVPFAHPVQRALIDARDGQLRPMFPAEWTRRTQDLAEAVHDAAQFYWLRADALLDPHFDPWRNARAYRFPRHGVIDLDEPADWEHAERLCEMRSPVRP